MRKQTGSRNRGWLPAIGNRLSVAAGVALAAGMLGAVAPWAEAVGTNATGGTITNYTANGTNFTAHIFTGDGTFTVTNTPAGITFDILVVAGGGGGGHDVGGGGGAGGLLYSNGVPITLSSYTVKIGAI
jgi:hypothetical protein